MKVDRVKGVLEGGSELVVGSLRLLERASVQRCSKGEWNRSKERGDWCRR